MPPSIKLTRRQTLNRLKRAIANNIVGMDWTEVMQSHRLSGPRSRNGLGIRPPRLILTREVNIAFADVGVKMKRSQVDAQVEVFGLREAIWKEMPPKHRSVS